MEDTADHFFALAPGTRLDEYEIVRIIGQGSFGITYLAEDVNLGTRFAIKEYLPSDWAVRDSTKSVRPKSTMARQNFEWGIDAFLKEARILASIDHPNIVRVQRFFRANGTAYIVMGLVEGRSFGDVLAKDYTEGGYPSEALRDLLSALLDGLSAVHAAGIIHRDIKPANILIKENGTPILIDFGAARNFQRTVAGGMTVIMTPGYAPIEQYAENDEQGPFTDLYSLGAVAFRAVSGRTPMEPYKRMGGASFVPAATLGRGRYPDTLLTAIDWAINIHAKDRPQTAADLKAALGPAVSVSAPDIATPQPVAQRTQRRSFATAGAACCALVLLAGAVAYWRSGSSDQRVVAAKPASPVIANEAPAASADAIAEAARREAERRAADLAQEEADRVAADKARQAAMQQAADTAAQEAQREAAEKAATEAVKTAEIAKIAAERQAAELAKQEAARKVAIAKEEANRRAAQLETERRAAEAKRLADQRAASSHDGQWYADLPRNGCGSVRVQAIAVGNVIFGAIGLPTLTKPFRASIGPDGRFASEGAINTVAGSFSNGNLDLVVVNQCAKWTGPAQRTAFTQELATGSEIHTALVGKTVKLPTGEASYAADGTYKVNDRNGVGQGRYTISDGAVCVRFASGVDRCDAIFKDNTSLVFFGLEGNRSVLQVK